MGQPGKGPECFVYAARTGGKIKIGCTMQPPARMRRLGGKLLYALEVVYDAARDVESEALVRLGRAPTDSGEWVIASDDAAIEALRAAWLAVSRFRHVDPALSPDEARRQRILLASQRDIG